MEKNALKCSTLDQDFELYFMMNENTIVFGDQDELINGGGDVWDIDKALTEEIIISQNKGTANERRLRFTPLSQTAM